MAPVLACRLLLYLGLFVLLISQFPNCYALLTYDRQTLLDIRTSFLAISKDDAARFIFEPCGSLPSDIQDCICRWPLKPTRRKRRRKRGRWAGISLRWKLHLQASCESSMLFLAWKPVHASTVVCVVINPQHTRPSRWILFTEL